MAVMEAFSSREREGCVFSLHERTGLKSADYRPTAPQEMPSDWITYEQCGDPFILCTCRQAQLPAAPCPWEKEGQKVSATAEEAAVEAACTLSLPLPHATQQCCTLFSTILPCFLFPEGWGLDDC